MERATPLSRTASDPRRRRLLKGAALAAVPYALLPETRADAQTQAIDYAPATWEPASSANYTRANRPIQYPVDFVVIHVTQTTYGTALGVFQNPKKKVSAHYVVRSADGHVAQCVPEADVAWHAGNWDYNTRSIGIEHEGVLHRRPVREIGPAHGNDLRQVRDPPGPFAHHRPLRGAGQRPHRPGAALGLGAVHETRRAGLTGPTPRAIRVPQWGPLDPHGVHGVHAPRRRFPDLRTGDRRRNGCRRGHPE
jgi:hypothetical protein